MLAASTRFRNLMLVGVTSTSSSSLMNSIACSRPSRRGGMRRIASSAVDARMWVKPARSLRVDIAVRLNRIDVLWRMAQPARPPVPVKAPAGVSPRIPKSEKPPALPKMWYTDQVPSDPDLQVQALGALLKTDGERVVPMLKQIAFESESPGPAIRAVFMGTHQSSARRVARADGRHFHLRGR